MIEQTQLVDVQQWIKTRASLDANESNFLSWSGNIYSFIFFPLILKGNELITRLNVYFSNPCLK